MTEQPGARRILQADAAKLAAVDVGNLVVARQPLVHEGVVRGQQVDDAPVVADLIVEQQFRFALEGVAQVVVELRELRAIRRRDPQIAQVQPLGDEVAHERA